MSTPYTVGTLPEALPQVTKFVPAHPPVLSTRQKAVQFLREGPGLDATLRLAQYSLRLSLYLRRKTLPKPLLVRLLAVVSSLAALRRLLALRSLLASAPGLRYLYYLLGAGQDLAKVASSPMTTPGGLSGGSGYPQLVQSGLELAAVVFDNLYLFSRLRLVPLSPRDSARVDKLSDFAALGAALVGLAQLQRERRELYDAGRQARRKTIEVEKKLDDLDFWEDVTKRRRGSNSAGTEEQQERLEEQRRLRERVKLERRRLKELRAQVRASRWERLRLTAEGVFAVYDVLDLERSAESVKSWAGITASLIEFGQAWVRHRGSQLIA